MRATNTLQLETELTHERRLERPATTTRSAATVAARTSVAFGNCVQWAKIVITRSATICTLTNGPLLQGHAGILKLDRCRAGPGKERD